ncbi:hypothetical protein B0J17DRAFT_223012 [Rhizoctonia solani]|nr:hypothetical protein B0J17DRAFT_223012 [Rhizoctonia solani]
MYLSSLLTPHLPGSFSLSSLQSNIQYKHFQIMNPYTDIKSICYRPKMLGLAILSSFVSATWAAANPLSFSNYVWTPLEFESIGNQVPSFSFDGHQTYIHVPEEDFYTFPIIALIYGTFLLVCVPKVILEWRLNIQVPLHMEYGYVGLAWCTQLVAIFLEDVATPNRTIWSNWGFINLTSVISLVALTTHLTLPILSNISRILVFMVLSERFRKAKIPDTLSQEPLLPVCSVRPVGNLEVRVLEGKVAGLKGCV